MMMRKLTTNKTKKKEDEEGIIINGTAKLAKKMRFSQNGDNSQEDLAKFGYRSGMKIKNIFTSFYFIFGYLLEPVVEI
jgi:hypothetical protein